MNDFKNPEINKRYVITGPDKAVKLPEGYTGNLSDISDIKLVENMISRKSNLVSARPVPPRTTAGPSAN